MRRPWMNPPMKYQLGATRGLWWETMSVLCALAASVFVVLTLVDRGVLGKGWGYAMIPVACIAAAFMGLITVFKAVGEEKQHVRKVQSPHHT